MLRQIPNTSHNNKLKALAFGIWKFGILYRLFNTLSSTSCQVDYFELLSRTFHVYLDLSMEQNRTMQMIVIFNDIETKTKVPVCNIAET